MGCSVWKLAAQRSFSRMMSIQMKGGIASVGWGMRMSWMVFCT